MKKTKNESKNLKQNAQKRLNELSEQRIKLDKRIQELTNGLNQSQQMMIAVVGAIRELTNLIK